MTNQIVFTVLSGRTMVLKLPDHVVSRGARRPTQDPP